MPNLTCQNPDDPTCDKEAALRVKDGRHKVCRQCYLRFWRHGDGKRLEPWDAYWKKKRTNENDPED